MIKNYELEKRSPLDYIILYIKEAPSLLQTTTLDSRAGRGTHHPKGKRRRPAIRARREAYCPPSILTPAQLQGQMLVPGNQKMNTREGP